MLNFYKKFVLALSIVLIMMASISLVSFASTSTTILPNGYYIPLSNPTAVISSGEVCVIVDDNDIHLVKDKSIYSHSLESRPTSYAIVGDNLYISYQSGDSDTLVGILSMLDYSYQSTSLPDCDVILVSDGDNLYYSAGSKLYDFDTQSTILTYSKLAEATSLDMVGDILHLTTIDGTYTCDLSSGDKDKLLDHNSTCIDIVGDLAYMVEEHSLTIYSMADDSVLTYTLPYQITTTNSISYNPTTKKLYLIDNQNHMVYSYTIYPTLTLSDTIGSHGQSIDRLNCPKDIYCANDTIYVADSANNRILNLSSDEDIIGEISISSPISVVSHNDVIYSTDGSSIYRISASGREVYSIEDVDIISIAVNGGGSLYALSNDTIWSLNDGVLTTYAMVEGAKNIAFSPIGYTLYVSTEDTVYRYLNSTTILDSITLDDTDVYGEIIDMDIDSLGNIYLLRQTTSNTITKLTKTQNGYEVKGIYNINATIPNATYDATCIQGGDILCISTNSHSLIRVVDEDMDIATEEDILDPTTPEVNLNDKTPLSSPLLIKNLQANTYVYTNPSNSESIRLVNADTKVIVLSEDTLYDGFSYILYGDKCVFAKTDMLASINDTVPSMIDAVTSWGNTKLYKYPIENNDYLITTLPRNTQVKCNGGAYGYDDGKWISISYMDNTYYIKSSGTLLPLNNTQQTARYDAKISAQSLGGSVDIYLLPTQNSQVLASVVDGTQVLTYEPIKTSEQYTKICVEIDGLKVVGYVLTSNLSTSSVTTPQLIAVLIILALSLATTITYIVVKKRRS